MPAVAGLDVLLPRLEAAVRLGEAHAITERVKRDLAELIAARSLRFPDAFRRPGARSYARRLLHRDMQLGYTAVVMAWGPGQGTPLHDHAGIWCVEGVVEGEMDVAQFELVEEAAGGLCRFAERGRVHTGPGSAGALIPPFEYHTLANALTHETSVTLHIYGGEMDHCSIFEPRAAGTFLRRSKTLRYDD